MEISGIAYFPQFINNPSACFEKIITDSVWDNSMQSRKTASYGTAYNYSQITYPDTVMPDYICKICEQIAQKLAFLPNNCLVNWYENGKGRMGFHSDQTDILADNTGVAIVSLGAERLLTFRKIGDSSQQTAFLLENGSLFYMNQTVQTGWQHAILADDSEFPRISLTFRQIRS
jgi:alkylated DNA repair dioxygenase AlkB